MNIREIQTRLETLGFNPGPIDGIRGRLTINATKEFQRSVGLDPDGIVGPLTMAALFPDSVEDTTSLSRPWFDEAKRLKGLREGAGSTNNPIIMDWADDLDLHYPDDATAWCGLFVGHCIAASLPDEPLPGNPLGARNWLGFGKTCDPVLGSVLVFWREKKSGWKGHVGFCAGEDSKAFNVLGGNQSDSVSIARVAKDRLLGARWPQSVPFVGEIVTSKSDGSLSTNEA